MEVGLYECDLSAIHSPDEHKSEQENTSEEKQELDYNSQSELHDLDVMYIEDSKSELEFDLLFPTRYSKESLHVGQLIRYADMDKDIWY